MHCWYDRLSQNRKEKKFSCLDALVLCEPFYTWSLLLVFMPSSFTYDCGILFRISIITRHDVHPTYSVMVWSHFLSKIHIWFCANHTAVTSVQFCFFTINVISPLFLFIYFLAEPSDNSTFCTRSKLCFTADVVHWLRSSFLLCGRTTLCLLLLHNSNLDKSVNTTEL